VTAYTDTGEINQLYPRLVAAVMSRGAVVSPKGIDTRELHPAMLIVKEPRQRLVTSYGRPINVPFALAEVLWILQGRDDVEMLKYYNSNISSYSDDGVSFNAAYGARLRSAFGHDQLEDVVRCLKADPDSRQATIVLSNPDLDRSFYNTGKPRSTKDRACNVLAHLMIRDGALDWYQVIRSNDALWGTPYNWMQWTHLQEYVACQLGVPCGDFIHNVDSMHIYRHQWDEAGGIRGMSLYEYFDYRHDVMVVDPRSLAAVHLAEAEIRSSGQVYTECDPGAYWKAVLSCLQSWSYYKDLDDFAALEELVCSDSDPVYGAATMRFYYYNRWYKPAYAAVVEEMATVLDAGLLEWITASHA
jgi:thymidylate synthase